MKKPDTEAKWKWANSSELKTKTNQGKSKALCKTVLFELGKNLEHLLPGKRVLNYN